jgi:SAM-dependent methyltransferase
MERGAARGARRPPARAVAGRARAGQIRTVKRTSAAALRNRAPLEAALRGALPPAGRVLELGSGTGEHAVHLARAFPGLVFQPSDPDPEARASIAAWAEEAALPNLLAPLDLDVRLAGWEARAADAVLCVNVLHVVPAECLDALCRGAARVLPAGGPLAVAGPFSRRGVPLAGRLARLDAALRAADPALGVREREALAEAGRRHDLSFALELALPAEGDLLIVLRRNG